MLNPIQFFKPLPPKPVTLVPDEVNRRIEANLHTGGAVVASGLSVFRPGEDGSCRQVFERADRRMYGRKSVLKAMKV